MVGGAAGSLVRYALVLAVDRHLQGRVPYGTLVVNTLGCFAFALLWSLLLRRDALSDGIRATVFVGFLGAFTTFSTFAFQTEELASRDGLTSAALNLLAHNILGLLAIIAGQAIGRSVAGDP